MTRNELLDLLGEESEAVEWVDYNTVRGVSYMGEKAPLIVEEI